MTMTPSLSLLEQINKALEQMPVEPKNEPVVVTRKLFDQLKREVQTREGAISPFGGVTVVVEEDR